MQTSIEKGTQVRYVGSKPGRDHAKKLRFEGSISSPQCRHLFLRGFVHFSDKFFLERSIGFLQRSYLFLRGREL
jgi:hypothetical protein